MGEIAEMMLEGTLCEWCGTHLGEGFGYPRLCPSCKAEDLDHYHHSSQEANDAN